MFSKVKAIWNSLPDGVKRVVHTAYQAFLGVFLLGITGVISDILTTGSLSDAKTALLALISAAVAAAISAVKTALTARWSKA